MTANPQEDRDMPGSRKAVVAGAEDPGDRELDSAIAELDAAFEKLPGAAIQWIREHRDLAVPRLVEVIRSAAASAQGGDVPDGNAHFFALFLLTEFQVKEALPVILEAVSLPGELPFDLFGDAITSVLRRILPALADGRHEVMDELIGKRDANEYVRWAAAESYIILVRDGRMGREEAVERLGNHLRARIAQEEEELAGYLVSTLSSLAPAEAREAITEAFDRNMVDPTLVRQEDIERSISEGDSRVRRELDRCGPIGIQDTVAELETWDSFREKPPAMRRPEREEPNPHAEAPKPYPRAEAPARSEPLPLPELPGRRVGRNKPCPCGSGKKYKKCCGLQV